MLIRSSECVLREGDSVFSFFKSNKFSTTEVVDKIEEIV